MLPARYHQGSGQVEWLTPRPLPPPPLAAGGRRAREPRVALRLLRGRAPPLPNDGRPLGDIGPERRADLTQGQQPTAIVVTCADSRVPEHLFDAGLGEGCSSSGRGQRRQRRRAGEHQCGRPLRHAAARRARSSACAAIAAAVGHGDDPRSAATRPRRPAAAAIERARHDGRSGDDLVAAAARCNAQLVVAQARQQVRSCATSSTAAAC
jgi:hypothetical protein